MSCTVLEVAMPADFVALPQPFVKYVSAGGSVAWQFGWPWQLVRSCSWHVTKEAGLGLCKSSARRCVFARKVIVGVRATGPGDS